MKNQRPHIIHSNTEEACRSIEAMTETQGAVRTEYAVQTTAFQASQFLKNLQKIAHEKVQDAI